MKGQMKGTVNGKNERNMKSKVKGRSETENEGT